MGMRRSQRLAKELANDRSASLGDRHLSRHVLRHLCEEADKKATSGDSDTLRVARLAVRLAGRLADLNRWRRRPAESAELAMAFARLAAALRMANRTDHAERALVIARGFAAPHQLGDLSRRRAWLRIYQDRLTDALEDAEKAVACTAGREQALSLGTLGATLFYCGDYSAAIRRLADCLTRLSPDDENRYNAMLVSYVGALAKGTDEEAKKALALCPRLRGKLKDRHKSARARLWWTEGLLHARLGDPTLAWRALDIARRSLLAMKAVPEVAAIVADMAGISPQPMAVRSICLEAAEVIEDHHPLAEPLEALTRAAGDFIPRAAAVLRQAAQQLSPCPSM